MSALPTIDLDFSIWGRPVAPSWALWDYHELPALLDEEFRLLYPERDLAAVAIPFEDELAGHIARAGAYHGVAQFLGAADRLEELRDRRAFVLAAAHTARMRTLPRLPLPAQGADRRRPRRLSELEMVALRAAVRDPCRTVLLRLLAAGATERETVQIAAVDVEVDGDDGLVALPGGRGVRPRTVLLAGCGHDLTRLQTRSRDGWLLAAGSDPTLQPRHENINKRLRRLLDATGFDNDRNVTVASIRLTALHTIAESFGFEAAAAVAGTTSRQRLAAQLAALS